MTDEQLAPFMPYAAGNKRMAVFVGVLCFGIGALGFWPAAHLRIYEAFLAALFVLATGITVLQVAANPYVALLGPESTASSRLTLAQALNSLGTAIAPIETIAKKITGKRNRTAAKYIGMPVCTISGVTSR